MSKMDEALFSPSASVLLTRDKLYRIAPDGTRVAGTVADAHVASWVTDWRTVPASGDDNDAARLKLIAAQQRAVDYVLELLVGVSPELQHSLCEETERLLSLGVQIDHVVSSVCVAPISRLDSISRLLDNAVHLELPLTTNLFTRIRDLQPLLRRLVEQWMAASDSYFIESGVTREDMWGDLTLTGAHIRLAESSSRQEFGGIWFSLLSGFAPAARASANALGTTVSDSIFPAEPRAPIPPIAPLSNPPVRELRRSPASPTDPLSGVLRQISAIARLVASGKDGRARKFLNQLIATQLSQVGGQEFAVKSLCNLAQKCAEMFRTDFERECLRRALEISPNNAWLLVQWGNHLKHLRLFEEALAAFERALPVDSRVARAGIADTYKEMGRFDRSRATYHEIPGWADDPAVYTALTDLCRAEGRLGEAKSGYEEIRRRWGYLPRAALGEAVFYRVAGRLSQSRAVLEDLLIRPDIDPKDRAFGQYELVRTLLQLGNAPEALVQVEALLSEVPFMMPARFKKAIVLGVLGREADGLNLLPMGRIDDVHSWRLDYLHGLLLLKAGNVSAAEERISRARVTKEADSRYMGPDEVSQGILVCAHLHLHKERENLTLVEELLGKPIREEDLYQRMLRELLHMHLAGRMNRRHEASSSNQLIRRSVRNVPGFLDATKALRRGDYDSAWHIQTDLFLRAS